MFKFYNRLYVQNVHSIRTYIIVLYDDENKRMSDGKSNIYRYTGILDLEKIEPRKSI